MARIERWYFIRDGGLWEHTENDGIAFLRRGAESIDTRLCSIEEAATRYPAELARARATVPCAARPLRPCVVPPLCSRGPILPAQPPKLSPP